MYYTKVNSCYTPLIFPGRNWTLSPKQWRYQVHKKWSDELRCQEGKKQLKPNGKKKRNKWCVYDVESRGLKIEIVKDLSTVVFASALWYQNIFFRFGNCALCTISRKYLLTMSSGLKPFLSYCDEFLDKTFLNVTFLKYKSYCAYLQLRLWISTITNYV